MFGIGFWEIAIILVIALVALGPDKLPKVARSLGRGMRELREAANGVRRAIDDETGDLRSDLSSGLEEIKQPFQEVRKPLDEFQQDIKQSVQQAVEEPSTEQPPSSDSEAEPEEVERDKTPRSEGQGDA